MRKSLILIILAIAGAASAQNFALLDSLLAGTYKGESAPAYTPLPNGEHYAQITDGCIYAYDFLKGSVVDTLYDKTFKFINKDPKSKNASMPDIEGFMVGTDRWLLVYANREQIYRRSFRADYYLVDTERREVRPLSVNGKQQSPLFSPDGRYIAFVRDANIFIHKIDFNTEIAVTTDGSADILNGTPDWVYEEEFGCRHLMAWGPDSKQLAFVRLDQTNVKTFAFQHFGTITGTGGTQWSGKSNDKLQLYPTTIEIRYPKAGESNAEPAVMVYDTYYKSLKKMALPELNDCYIPRIRFTLKEDELAIFRLNRRQNVLEMFYANPKSTVCHSIYREESRNGAIDYATIDEWQWLETGDMVVVSEQDGYRHAHLYDSQGGKRWLLTSGQADVTQVYGVDEDGNMFFQVADPSPTQRMIRMLNITSPKKVFTLTTIQDTHNAVFSSNFHYFIDNCSGLSHPLKSDVVKANNGKVLRNIIDGKKTQKAWASLNMPKKTVFHFRTERHDDLDGWLLLPADTAGKTFPLVLLQYSGPDSQSVLDRWNPGWEYFLVQEGYAVACIDVRGSGARGAIWRAKTYGQLGKLEAEDLISTAKHLASSKYIDSERMAIWGWSYGGFQVLTTMSQNDNPFKAGIAVAPVTDWMLYDAPYAERYMNRPQENQTGYEQSSLLNMADKLNGKLLLVSGTADDNVHFQNTVNYVHRLIEADKDFKLLLFPDENHYIRQGNSHKYLYRQMFRFLEDNLK